jgi:hypothetical protein
VCLAFGRGVPQLEIINMKIEITGRGIYGAKGEVPVGTQLTVENEPKGWEGRYRVLSGGPAEGSEGVNNSAYSVVNKGGGYYVVTKDDEPVTKSLRKDDLDGFDGLSEEDKAAFVELHKKEA